MTANRNFRELEKSISNIASNYFLSQSYFEKNTLIGSGEVSMANPFQSYLSKVANTFNRLDELEKTIINNEFFFQNYAYWWRGKYSRATYYRLKRKAMNRFMEAFEDED